MSYREKLSVIIPVKNREDTLCRCLDSAISQNIDDMEIICIDDFSEDSSVEIIKSYIRKDNRIKLIDRRETSSCNYVIQGVASARNLGLNAAKGEFIAFIDSDDWIEKHSYHQIIKNYTEDIDLVVFAANIIDKDCILSQEDYEYTTKYYNPHIEKKNKVTPELLSKVSTSLWNKIFRTSIIKEYNINFSESLIFEDYEFVFKYLAHCKNLFFLNNRYYNYVQHNNSIMGEVRNKKNYSQFYSLIAFLNVYKHYEKHNLVEKYKDALKYLLIKSYNDDLYFFADSEDTKVCFDTFVSEILSKIDKNVININEILLQNNLGA